MNIHGYAKNLICIFEEWMSHVLLAMSNVLFGTKFANLRLTYANIWLIYYDVYCRNPICIMGCHGNDKNS